jgi:hypothetical protein
MRTIITLLALALAGVPLLAQFATTPIHTTERMWYESGLLRDTSNAVHTAVLPLRRAETTPYDRRTELLPDSIEVRKGLLPWIGRKLWREDLFRYTGDNYDVSINPIVGFVVGQESESATYDGIYQNSRGAHIEGVLGEKVSFYTTLVETQARFAAHTNQLTRQNRVVPGYWLTKSFRDSAYDFAYVAGEVAYTPNKLFHFRLGRGKQFFGEGHRSMLLSDNSVNYPFFRIETTFGKVKYVNLWSVMNDIRREIAIDEDVFAKKYLSMHYLSMNLGQRWNVGLFEALMWGDELRRYGFDANFLNPIIMYRPVEFAQGFSGGNMLLGMNASYRTNTGIRVYGQLMIDEFNINRIREWSEGPWQNMMAVQLGTKWGDAFGVENLFLRAEYNTARPHAYSHRDILTNWGHYAQPLAHPLGANFRELLLHLHYRRGRWQGQAAIHSALIGRDENKDANWGGNIFKSFDIRSADTDVFVGNGRASQLLYWRAELNYVINPVYNLRLQAGIQSRTEDEPTLGLPNSRTVYFGLKTNMYDLYQDY